MVINILIYAIVARALLSFVPQLKPSNKLVSILFDITDPLLKPFQRFQIGVASMGIDFSPVIAIFALSLIQRVIIGLLYAIF